MKNAYLKNTSKGKGYQLALGDPLPEEKEIPVIPPSYQVWAWMHSDDPEYAGEYEDGESDGEDPLPPARLGSLRAV